MRLLSLSAFMLATALVVPAYADSTNGTILAYDRVANVIILTDKSVWSLGPTLTVPEDLKAGDTITLTFNSAGDEGVTKVAALERTGD